MGVERSPVTWSSLRQHVLVAALLAGFAITCSLASLDDLTRGSGPIGDSGPDVTALPASPDGTAAQDAPNDVADSSPSDAGVETSAGPWCLTQDAAPFYCADFDEGSLTTAYGAGTVIQIAPPRVGVGGDASIDTVALSPPGAFLASAFPPNDAGVIVRYEDSRVAFSKKGATLRFDLFAHSMPPEAKVDLVAMLFDNPDGGSPVRLYLGRDPTSGFLFLDNQGLSAQQQFTFPPSGGWHTFELRVALDATPVANLNVDGVSTAQTTLAPSFTRAQSARFYLGVRTANQAPASVAFDNVAFMPE